MRRPIGFVVLAALAAGGCATTQSEPDAQFELHKAQTELRGSQRDLAQERARSAGLVSELETRTHDLDALRAENAAQKQRLVELNRTNEKLDKLMGEKTTAPLEKPAVQDSPLPDGIDRRLAEFAQKSGGRVVYLRARGAVSFANDRLFDSGSDAVRPDSFGLFKSLAEILNAAPTDDFEFIIVGHTDSQSIVGDSVLAKHPSNWYLSVHRAIAVRDLLAKYGVAESRVGVMGYADQRPAGADPAKNRRVEVFVVTKGAVQPLPAVKTR